MKQASDSSYQLKFRVTREQKWHIDARIKELDLSLQSYLIQLIVRDLSNSRTIEDLKPSFQRLFELDFSQQGLLVHAIRLLTELQQQIVRQPTVQPLKSEWSEIEKEAQELAGKALIDSWK